jgi:hypothetical protein
MITQGVQLEAPFAVKEGASYKATFGSTRADLYTDLYVNGDAAVSGALSVGGTDIAVTLADKQDALEQPGLGDTLLYDGNRLKRSLSVATRRQEGLSRPDR